MKIFRFIVVAADVKYPALIISIYVKKHCHVVRCCA